MLRFWKLIFLISPALTLVVPSGNIAGPFFMALAGLFYWKKATKNTPVVTPFVVNSWAWMLGGFGAFVVVGVALALWHSNHAGHYEMYAPFILFPAIALLIRAGRWQAEPWLLSVAVGALSAFFYAVYQVFELNIGRATGATSNPIPFGDTAIVLAMVALVSGVMFPFEGARARWKRAFVVVSGIAGIGASLLSGSKGGWISLFIIGATITYLATQHWSSWRKHLALFAIFMSLVVAGFLAPSNLVQDRVISGLKGGLHWIRTGEVNEGSVGMRFEIWKLNIQLVSEKPLLGHGSIGARERFHEMIDAGYSQQALVDLAKYSPKFVSVDNELLGALVGGGVIGVLSLLAGYLGAWMAFWGWRKHMDLQVKSLCTIGLLLVPLYLEFGLSVAVFGTTMFRTVFVLLSVVLLAFITVRLEALKVHP